VGSSRGAPTSQGADLGRTSGEAVAGRWVSNCGWCSPEGELGWRWPGRGGGAGREGGDARGWRGRWRSEGRRRRRAGCHRSADSGGRRRRMSGGAVRPRGWGGGAVSAEPASGVREGASSARPGAGGGGMTLGRSRALVQGRTNGAFRGGGPGRGPESPGRRGQDEAAGKGSAEVVTRRRVERSRGRGQAGASLERRTALTRGRAGAGRWPGQAEVLLVGRPERAPGTVRRGDGDEE